MPRVGVDDFAGLGRIERVLALASPHVEKRVAGSGEAEGEIAVDGVEIVATEAKARFDRNQIVEIDERIDFRQPVAGEHPLDQPLHGGSVAGLLDSERPLRRAPRRDPGNGREFDPGPALAASRLGFRDLAVQRRRAMRGDGEALGDNQGDPEIGKFRRQFRDDELGQVRLTRAVEARHSRHAFTSFG
jgi:hypothetical protein